MMHSYVSDPMLDAGTSAVGTTFARYPLQPLSLAFQQELAAQGRTLPGDRQAHQISLTRRQLMMLVL